MIQMRALLDKTNLHHFHIYTVGTLAAFVYFPFPSAPLETWSNDRSQRHAECKPECPREC